MNKKIIYFASLVFSIGIITGLSSCEEMLEEKPFDFISGVEDSDAGADQLVIGTYSYLLDDMFRWDEFPKVLDMDCDYATGPDWSLSEIGAGNFQGTMDPVWNKSYTLIHRANNAIEVISTMGNVSESKKLNDLGELKFLKAWAYFLLVRAYGDVPIYYESVNQGTDFNQPRQSIATVYEYIIELLKEAEKGMYTNQNSNYVEGRASAGAAASLLAKVYVTIASASLPSGDVIVKGGVPYVEVDGEKVFTNPVSTTFTKNQVAGYETFDSKEYFRLAMEKAEQVMNKEYGEYGLLSFDNLWSQAYKNKTEHIWSIQAKSGDSKYGMGLTLYYTGIENSSGVVITGLWHGLRDHWYKLFEKNDLRVADGVIHRWIRSYQDTEQWQGGSFYPNNDEWSIKARGYYVTGEDTVRTDPITGEPFQKDPLFDDGRDYQNDNSSAYIAFLTKYYDASDRTQSKTDVNWPVLRYADVLLTYAEAANEYNGAPTAEALNALNLVRGRSSASLKSLDGASGIGDLVSFRSAVLEERARELALEGDRRWDLIRWGIYLQVMNSIGGNDEVGIRKIREEKHLLYPIPTDEVLNNSAINKNNPGW
ncbi:RagB/SusD family nutrient uptake outer membrane protein [Geofilum sp. OHC36d9]|uniref:RagB/SusD family nutrient uptake outer membrane protein n=1 Tax=Geofilum sp. OHC36d9 TaxID=3458413 RepID=UPI0040345A7F